MSTEIEAPSEPINKTQEVYQLVKTKIENGFQVTDKKTITELNKLVRDELKLSTGWSSDVKEQIAKVLSEKNISLADKGFNNNKFGSMKVDLIKEESAPEPTQTEPQTTQQNQTIPQSPHGTLPKGFSQESSILPRAPTQTEQQEQSIIKKPLEPMTDEQKRQQEKLIVKSFGFLEEIYVALGIVKGTEEEQKAISEPKPLEKFHADVQDFAKELNDYMIDNDVRLPMYLNTLALGISGFMIFGLPMVKVVVFGKNKKPTYDDRFKDIEVKV